jgi:hypothetical protein
VNLVLACVCVCGLIVHVPEQGLQTTKQTRPHTDLTARDGWLSAARRPVPECIGEAQAS